MRGVWRASQWILTAAVMVWALPRFDVFVLASLPLSASVPTIAALRLARKRVIVLFNGSETRPPYLDGAHHGDLGASELVRVIQRQRGAVRAMERWAHVVVSHTASSQFLTRPFVPLLIVGVPALDTNVGTAAVPGEGTQVRIIHAPSDPAAKGSACIRRAISNLQRAGMSIEYVELSGFPHDRVVAELARADLVVDQLYSDQPMPGLATEASSLGKAVVIGGYDWDAVKAENSLATWPPTVQIHPHEILATVRTLVQDRDLRISHGRLAREFVLNQWTPARVAERFLQLAGGDYPREWLFAPDDIRAVYGWGMEARRSRDLIASLISFDGRQALGLSHVPAVERRVAARALEGQT
jgi:hypothetical protein